MRTWDQWSAVLASLGVAAPAVVVDAKLKPALDRIERPDALLEPERISTSTGHSRGVAIGLGCLYALLAVKGAFDRDWQQVILMGGLAFMFVASLPSLRAALRHLRNDENAPTAGPGYVEDRKGRLWTVDDSVMFIAARRPAGPLAVCLQGPAGRTAWHFARVEDPDFQALWPRWAHPRPRPELAKARPTEPAVASADGRA